MTLAKVIPEMPPQEKFSEVASQRAFPAAPRPYSVFFPTAASKKFSHFPNLIRDFSGRFSRPIFLARREKQTTAGSQLGIFIFPGPPTSMLTRGTILAG
jgi:hypothetical protein